MNERYSKTQKTGVKFKNTRNKLLVLLFLSILAIVVTSFAMAFTPYKSVAEEDKEATESVREVAPNQGEDDPIIVFR